MIPISQSYLFSSDPENGALNVNNNGSTFDVSLNSPIQVPRDAHGATIEVVSSHIWYTVPNISNVIGNDKLYIITDHPDPLGDPIPGGPNFEITIPKGLYSVEALAVAIQRELVNIGLPEDLIELTGDYASQRSVLTFNSGGFDVQLDFTKADSFREILGFDARLVPLAPVPNGHFELGDTVAEFNRVNSFLITTSLISSGIPVNNIGSGVIAQVPIDVESGHQINFHPFNPLRCSADELVGRSVNYLSFALQDQKRRLVDTNDEKFSFNLVLRYWISADRYHGMSSAKWS